MHFSTRHERNLGLGALHGIGIHHAHLLSASLLQLHGMAGDAPS